MTASPTTLRDKVPFLPSYPQGPGNSANDDGLAQSLRMDPDWFRSQEVSRRQALFLARRGSEHGKAPPTPIRARRAARRRRDGSAAGRRALESHQVRASSRGHKAARCVSLNLGLACSAEKEEMTALAHRGAVRLR